jgi:Trk K+ transport system NAD-binding subunit
MLTHSELDPVMTFGSGEVSLVAIEAPHQLAGRLVKNLVVPGEISVASITRHNQAFIPYSGSEFREGDLIYVLVLASAMDRLKDLLGLGEGG